MVSDIGNSLLTGRRLGAYEVHERIGVGGMGEVYRARDPKLGRDVAIKFCRGYFTNDPDRLARFEREARVLASLNHPHIGAIYGLEDADGVRALVLELVDGETLADRIARGPIPLHETFAIARQIADALEAAHEKGIVHRDLKPANIKLTPDGVVKVLTLAWRRRPPRRGGRWDAVTDDDGRRDERRSHSRDGDLHEPRAGEGPARRQTRGRVGVRGRALRDAHRPRAFEGETISDVLAKVIQREPDWSALPASTPPRLRELLRRCARKDPKTRLQAIGDARVQIDELISGATEDTAAIVVTQPREQRARVRMDRRGAVARDHSCAGSSRYAVLLRVVPELLMTRFEIPTPPTSDPVSFALSADGRQLAFVATAEGASRLFVRPLDQVTARPLAGTEGARYPFWKPDGRAIGFFADGKLKTIDLGSVKSQVWRTRRLAGAAVEPRRRHRVRPDRRGSCCG